MSQTPEQFADRMRRYDRRARVIPLEHGINAMAYRLSDSVADRSLAWVTDNKDIAARHQRAVDRRRKALRRLVAALANFAVDGA